MQKLGGVIVWERVGENTPYVHTHVCEHKEHKASDVCVFSFLFLASERCTPFKDSIPKTLSFLSVVLLCALNLSSFLYDFGQLVAHPTLFNILSSFFLPTASFSLLIFENLTLVLSDFVFFFSIYCRTSVRKSITFFGHFLYFCLSIGVQY